MSYVNLRRARRAVQWVALAAYVYLLFAALQRRAAFPLADVFYRLDPLVAISSMVAGRIWIARLVPALFVIALTLLVGRVWCGWLCPLGTVLDLAGPRRRGRARRITRASDWAARHDAQLRRVKHFLFLLIVAGALLGNLTLLALDPITILTRAMTTAVIPVLNRLVTGAESALYALRPLRGPIAALEGIIRGPVLPVKQSVYIGSVLLGGLLLGIVALNALAPRFWCRYLCPLGGLLSLLSRVSLFRRRVTSECARCGLCGGTCSMETIDPYADYESDPGECTLCMECFAACPQDAVGIERRTEPIAPRPYDPSRRQALAALGAAAAGVVLLNGEASLALPDIRLIRPPGATDERRFLSLCARCSQCIKACPTSGLQASLDEAGLRGLWTPRLVPRLGYCDYSCNACGQACPTGAIPRQSLEEKRVTVLGKAYIDTSRCLAWADGIPCIVCEEMCPVPDKAVRLTEATMLNATGQTVTLQQPRVLRDLCIGCGICEYQCPLPGEAAIRVRRS